MGVQKDPWLISIYKGEGRILIVPIIDHIAGYSVCSDWFININDIGNYNQIGSGIISAVGVVKISTLSSLTPKERELNSAWKKNSKYKSWISFWKNNYCAHLKAFEGGEYEVYSTEKTQERKGGYNGCIKKISLPSIATAEEIGEAVIDVFKAAEEFYEK